MTCSPVVPEDTLLTGANNTLTCAMGTLASAVDLAPPPGGVASIPTLSAWGLILLSTPMAWRHSVVQRRRHGAVGACSVKKGRSKRQR